jgi:hypothetical protein
MGSQQRTDIPVHETLGMHMRQSARGVEEPRHNLHNTVFSVLKTRQHGFTRSATAELLNYTERLYSAASECTIRKPKELNNVVVGPQFAHQFSFGDERLENIVILKLIKGQKLQSCAT